MGFIQYNYDRQSIEKYFHFTLMYFPKDLESQCFLVLFLLTPLVLLPHLETYTECGLKT